MSFNIQSIQAHSRDNFDNFIELLKTQKVLPQDTFIQKLPFFNLDPISKESQVLELFNPSNNAEIAHDLLKGIVSVEVEEKESSSSSSPSKMMTFAQLCLYKVLPCSNSRCQNRPREIVTHNQYKDSEYECPFYHHDRDRRRIVLTSNKEEEDFIYKANYYEEGRNHDERIKYSQNYFESMFHPLYYKLFRCKRGHCNKSHFCPFYHSEQEKKSWDGIFDTYLKKGRVTYVKDKQKYYESTSQLSHETVQNPKSITQQSSSSSGKNQSQGLLKNKRHQLSPNNHYEKRNKNFSKTENRIGKKISQFQSEENNWMKNSGYLSAINLNQVPSTSFNFNKSLLTNRV